MAGVIAVCLTGSAFATDPNRMVSQYVHTTWGAEKGFPGGSISSIAQTGDGYLWIGTDRGLIRFDGLGFRKFEIAKPNSLPIGPVKSLLADDQGNLWVLLQFFVLAGLCLPPKLIRRQTDWLKTAFTPSTKVVTERCGRELWVLESAHSGRDASQPIQPPPAFRRIWLLRSRRAPTAPCGWPHRMA